MTVDLLFACTYAWYTSYKRTVEAAPLFIYIFALCAAWLEE